MKVIDMLLTARTEMMAPPPPKVAANQQLHRIGIHRMSLGKEHVTSSISHSNLDCHLFKPCLLLPCVLHAHTLASRFETLRDQKNGTN